MSKILNNALHINSAAKRKLCMIFEKYYLNFSYNAGSNNILCSTIHRLCKNSLIVFLKKVLILVLIFENVKNFKKASVSFFLIFIVGTAICLVTEEKLNLNIHTKWNGNVWK